jgi:truncated hemoglobin YjbI
MRLRVLSLVAALLLSSLGCPPTKVERPHLEASPTSPIKATTTPIAPSPRARPPITLKILSPREGEVISAKGANPLRVTFSLWGYELQHQGQYLLVVLDNNVYQACYDLSAPFTFQHPLSPGVHTIRAFPVGGPMTEGASLHESLKEASAFAMTTFTVGKPDPKQDSKVKPGDPLLTFSYPRGEYIGEKAKKIMLDFWVQNAPLGPDAYQVKYTVNGGKEVTLTEWKKTFLEGLPLGDSVIELWLVGPDGQVVPGPFNRVSRKILLKEFAAKSLFERLGGQAAIEVLVGDLLYFISQDEALRKRFAKVNLKHLQAQLSLQLCEATGGLCQDTETSRKMAHVMNLSGKEFEAFGRHLTRALIKNQIPAKEQAEVSEALGSLRPQLVKE